jgi:hypothetical protein
MPIIRKQPIGTAAALLFMLTAATPILGWSQTETKQSTNTIYEKRIYAVKVGEMVETKRLFTTIGWPALVEGKFDKNVVGYFISDTGDLHQLIIILRFDSDQDRRDFWKRLYADERFLAFVKKFRPLIFSQNVQLMVSAPWGPQP